MNPRSVGWGVTAAGALVGFYAAVVALSGGWKHLIDQSREDGWLLAPIILAFGTQVALTVELRLRHRAQHLGAATGAGTGGSAVGMVACCAHHLVDVLPLLGAAGIAGFLFDWRIPLMVAGLLVNVAAVTVAGRRLAHLNHRRTGAVSCAA